MGTPEFAVPCLERLVADGHEVVGVFTQPDKPKGRGHKMQFPPVKEKAVEYNIPVFQPTKMKDGTAYGILKELDPELIIIGSIFARCRDLLEPYMLPVLKSEALAPCPVSVPLLGEQIGDVAAIAVAAEAEFC